MTEFQQSSTPPSPDNSPGRSPQPLSIQPPASIWHYKPWWCQPWSILLTGITIIGGSWYILGVWWLTALIAIPILGWMVLFLWVYPRLMADYLAQSDNGTLLQRSIPPDSSLR